MKQTDDGPVTQEGRRRDDLRDEDGSLIDPVRVARADGFAHGLMSRTPDDGLRDALRKLADEFTFRERQHAHFAKSDSYCEGQRDAWDVAESKLRALLTGT